MKDASWAGSGGGGGLCPETYHGTRMNRRALDFHTQLHDWSDAQQLTTLIKSHPRVMPARANTEIYLPVKRLAQIENWTKDVNKYYRPDRGPRVRSGSFMVIDVSKFNLKSDKTDLSRAKSAMYPTHSKSRIASAVSAGSTIGGQRRFFGTDVHSVNNKLIDTQMHYSAQRRNLYSASTKKSPATDRTPDMTLEDTTIDLQPDLAESENGEVSSHPNSARPSEPAEEHPSHIGKEILQPQITARSWSNKMLNFISIDDCKLTCRYRPQTIKEAHEVPCNVDDEGKRPGAASARKGKKVAAGTEAGVETGEEADDEETSDTVEAAESRLNGIHIEAGTDTNNNHSTENIQQPHHKNENTDKPNKDDSTDNVNGETVQSNRTSTASSSVDGNNSGKVNFKAGKELCGSRSQSDKTSYGRITNLYSTSLVTADTKDKKRMKQTRTYKLNHAINDMVEGRKVMNSMERDFDTRTSQFGRTIVEKSDGSQTFQKIHANLRKKMDSYLNAHSAIKTQQFYEQRRKNSTASPTQRKNSKVENGAEMQ